jgi:dephospho-CoA kinase
MSRSDPNEDMMHVGLTGGIGSGKSTVAALFQKHGAFVIDYDYLAHVVVEPGKPAWKDIVDFFGHSILKDDRTLDRPRIGQIVFADNEKRKKLESFIYPRLGEEYSSRIEVVLAKNPDAIVMADVPLLIEKGMQGLFEKIILVYATREQQLQRLTARDGLDIDSALKRLAAQMPIDEKLQFADYVIRNTGSIEEVEVEVNTIWNELVRLNEQKIRSKR